MKILFILGVGFLWGGQLVMLMVGLVIIITMYSFYMYDMVGGFWFGYVFLLVMLSGVLVVFSYMLSLMPNKEFELGSGVLGVVLFGVFMTGSVSMSESWDYSIGSISLWEGYLGYSTLYGVSFLFLIMLMAVWLSMSDEGSIRGW